MPPEEPNRRFDEIKRCLAEADRAFARAGAVTDERERLALIEEAETWLVRAERRLARLTDRQTPPVRPERAPTENRSFGDARPEGRGLVWRRRPHA
ncbi:MAG: hypothetical protein JWP49_1015 [Phenylobacterium sp.]|nr:hypothetical protein [Phenylobacterium sp.]